MSSLWEEIDKIVDKGFWDTCLQSHTDVAAGYSYNHQHGKKETVDAILAAVRKRVEGMKKKPPEQSELVLTVSSLSLAADAVKFHGFNEAIDAVLKELEDHVT